ncbi:hypothetical protein L249_5053, partial [Ophiocordyceps polyrhachis-furcata BCC 54312]
ATAERTKTPLKPAFLPFSTQLCPPTSSTEVIEQRQTAYRLSPNNTLSLYSPYIKIQHVDTKTNSQTRVQEPPRGPLISFSLPNYRHEGKKKKKEMSSPPLGAVQRGSAPMQITSPSIHPPPLTPTSLPSSFIGPLALALEIKAARRKEERDNEGEKEDG